MSILRKNVVTTPEEYLEGENYSEVKHEYVNGHIYAMVGVSRAHGTITGNLHALLHGHLRGTPCRVYASDIKVRKGDTFYYPDLVVACVETKRHDYYVEEPVLVVEVLSPSTQARDRLDKRLVYQSILTLQEYVLVAQDTIEAQIYRRAGEAWDLETYGPNEDLHLTAIDFACSMEALYQAAWD